MKDKIQKFIKRYNPFDVKVGDAKINWLVKPKISKEGIESKDLEIIGQDFLNESKFNFSVDAPLSDNVNVQFKFKGNKNDNNIELKFTKNF